MFNSYCARQLFVSLMRAKVLYLLHRLNVTAGKHRALRVLRNSLARSPIAHPLPRPHPILRLAFSFSVASPTAPLFTMYPLRNAFSPRLHMHLARRTITRSSRSRAYARTRISSHPTPFVNALPALTLALGFAGTETSSRLCFSV